MHFRTLLIADIPPICEDEDRNQKISKLISELERKKQLNADADAFDIYLGILENGATSFSRAVAEYVAEIMEPYSAEPSEEYLEFCDETDSLQEEYAQRVDCLKLPNGRIVEYKDYPYYFEYSIKDGKVYQKNAGPLHHEKRTKKAKKITFLHGIPRSKIYKSFNEFAENRCGFSFNEEHQAYGSYWNPNAMWDWYQIGGRWPEMFLVKSDCREYSFGERSWCNENSRSEAPEGYIWVAAARKKDICWDVMRDWGIQKATERFYRLEKIFADGGQNGYPVGKIVEDGIIDWDCYLYKKGESLEEYLERRSISKTWKYPLNVYSLVASDGWFAKDDCELHDELDNHIDNIDEEAVLVGIDYHI